MRNTAETLRGTLLRPPLVLPCFFAYFFFAAFFAAFFAGFFAAFLVAIFIYSPYSCTATSNAAVNECIEFLKKSVKKKMQYFVTFCVIQDRSHDKSDREKLKTHARV
jgi:hypothetical protein